MAFLPSVVSSLEQLNGDLSLVPKPPPKPVIFGVPFGNDPQMILKKAQSMGMPMESHRRLDKSGRTQVFTFSGTPKTLPIQDGKTEFLFFDKELIRIDFLFPPSYKNFLVVRQEVYRTGNDRFKVDRRQEVIDDQLRAHLAQLGRGEYTAETEGHITSAMLKGSTFFFYSLKDRKQQINATYSYYSPPNKEGRPEPELRLHYSLKEGLDKYKTHRKSMRPPKSIR